MDTPATAWLMANGGPIIRYRVARELMETDAGDLHRLREDVARTPEVAEWLGHIVENGNVHGSCDTAFENAVGKLLEFGLERTFEEFDDKVQPYYERVMSSGSFFLPVIAVPFFIRAGYHDRQDLKQWFSDRVEALYRTACDNDHDYFRKAAEKDEIPKAWQDKPVYRGKFMSDCPMPTIYDLYGMAYYPRGNQALDAKMDSIAEYWSHESFQRIDRGYGWARGQSACASSGSAWLACCTQHRRVLFVELASRFAPAVKADWFQTRLADLESYRNESGRYRFPSDYLKEKRNSYLIYAGAHMALGEDRRKKSALEIESTFRMALIRRNMVNAGQ
jgi:hypothetical protein